MKLSIDPAPKRRSALEGPALVAIAAAVTAALVGITFAVVGAGEAGLRSGIRSTARIGAVVVAVVFATSAANALWRTRWSKWLLRNRRYLGVGFGVIHLTHGALVIALGVGYPTSFWASTTMTGVIGGSVGYVFLLAMMLTSVDAAVRALGRSRWRALHKSGMYVLWGIFVFSYAGRVASAPAYAVLLGVLVGAYALRVVAALKRRR